MDNTSFFQRLISTKVPFDFEKEAVDLFRYQAKEVQVYADYLAALHINPADITKVSDIPFLPIRFFKSHSVVSARNQREAVFESSGSTGITTSKHTIDNLAQYLENSKTIFQETYGSLDNYIVLGLLPSYLERKHSSLVAMTDHFIKETHHELSGFYLNDLNQLIETIDKGRKTNRQIIVIGVTFALLELAEKYPSSLRDVIVIETGGMKGRRKEMIRSEVHDILKERLDLKSVHSEYGMTELLSQAWSKGDGIFETPRQMRVYIRDVYDPFKKLPLNKTGVLCIADLANIETCGFIETEDIGTKYSDSTFAVHGRLDNSDLRGCNLLVL